MNTRFAVLSSRLKRLIVVGLVAVALWSSAIGLYAPTAVADQTSASEAYKNGPIRQSHNYASKDNFQGGVKPEALEQRETDARQPEADKGLIETIKDKLTGSDSDAEPAPANLEAQKNPTLRYTEDQQ